jgi:hypothetical protein
MDIHSIKITKKDVERASAKVIAATPASFSGDACDVFKKARPLLEIAIAVLSFTVPPASAAISAVVAILDKACE